MEHTGQLLPVAAVVCILHFHVGDVDPPSACIMPLLLLSRAHLHKNLCAIENLQEAYAICRGCGQVVMAANAWHTPSCDLCQSRCLGANCRLFWPVRLRQRLALMLMDRLDMDAAFLQMDA